MIQSCADGHKTHFFGVGGRYFVNFWPTISIKSHFLGYESLVNTLSTHIPTPTHPPTHPKTHPHTHRHTHTISHPHTHTHTHTISHPHTITHTHTHIQTLLIQKLSKRFFRPFLVQKATFLSPETFRLRVLR